MKTAPNPLALLALPLLPLLFIAWVVAHVVAWVIDSRRLRTRGPAYHGLPRVSVWGRVVAILLLLPAVGNAHPPEVWDALAEAMIDSRQPAPDPFPPQLGSAIERVCERRELWPAGRGWAWNTSTSCQMNLQWARRESSELRDAPLLGTVALPPTKDARDNHFRAWEWYEFVRDMQPMAADWDRCRIQILINDARWRVGVWRLLWDAADVSHNPPDWVCQRRRLDDLRQMVGDEAFYAGEWPAPFPWWLLPRTR